MPPVKPVMELLLTRRFALPALLFSINIGCAGTALMARNWKKGIYWFSSAVFIAMVSI